MPIKHLNPTDLMKPLGYSHAVITTGGKTIYIAGQGAFNKNWQLVGSKWYVSARVSNYCSIAICTFATTSSVLV